MQIGSSGERPRAARLRWAASLACIFVLGLESRAVGQPCQVNGDCDDGIPCTLDQCFVTGVCIHTDLCENVFICDGVEQCCAEPGGCGAVAFGSCVPGTPITCPPDQLCSELLGHCVECEQDAECADTNECTFDDCQPSGFCAKTPLTGTTCNDAVPCTTADTCLSGSCTGTPVNCQPSTPPCHTGSCEPFSGECVYEPVGDGTSCDDGNACTPIDECTAGICLGSGPNGCVDLELRLPSSLECAPGTGTYCFVVGDVVEAQLFAVANGCPPPPPGLCGGTAQPVAGVQVLLTWDSRFLELADPADIGQPNPHDPCDDFEPCNTDCGLADRYNWSSSLFPKDCLGDRINEPCPSGFPQNDGDALYLALEQPSCEGQDAPPACVSSSGLWVTTLKFRVIGATAGLAPFTSLGIEPCVGQTRTNVADGGVSTGDVTGSVGPPLKIVAPCDSHDDCLPGTQCLAGECGICSASPPLVQSDSLRQNRYLTANGANPGRSTAMRVRLVSLPNPHRIWNQRTFWAGEPRVVCELSGMGPGDVCPPGAPTALFAELTCDGPYFTDWSALGMVHLYHESIVPGGIYEVQMIDSACPMTEASFSLGVATFTARWGDVAGPYDASLGAWSGPDGGVDVVVDVVSSLDKFANRGGAPIKARVDVEPLHVDRLVNITDVTRILDGFRGSLYPFAPGPDPCAF